MPSFPVPSLPTNGCIIWVRMNYPPRCAFMLAYESSGSLSGPFDHVQFETDWDAYMLTWKQHMICSGDSFRNFWVFWNTGTIQYSFPMGPVIALPAAGTFDSHMLCPCFRKASVGYPTKHFGHMFGPRMPQQYYVNNTWSPAALSVYQNFADKMLIGFSTQGVNFFPAIYSPKDNFMYRVGSWSLVRRPSTRYSRRDRPLPHWTWPPTYPVIT